MLSKKRLPFALAAVAVVAAAASASAETRYWAVTSGESAQFGDVASWTPEPSSMSDVGSDTLIINKGVENAAVLESGDDITVDKLYLGEGANGAGRLDIPAGKLTSTHDVSVGYSNCAGTENILNINGGNFTTKGGQNNPFRLGVSGKGTLEMSSGYLKSDHFYLGCGGEGVFNMSGGSAEISGEWQIGKSSVGNVHVSGDANIRNNHAMYFGNNQGEGSLTIDGGSVYAHYSINFSGGKGVVNLNRGGRLSTMEFAGNGSGVFNWNGGILSHNSEYWGSTTDIISSTKPSNLTVNVGVYGAIYESEDENRNDDISHPLSGIGALVKRGAGKLTVTGALDLRDGIKVEGGTLVASNFTSPSPRFRELSVASGATLDLGGASVTVAKYECQGTLNNGTVTVLSAEENTAVTAKWTNALGDGDIANPLNWETKNANDDDAFSAPASATTTIDLNGQDLHLAANPFAETVTFVNSGEKACVYLGENGADKDWALNVTFSAGVMPVFCGAAITIPNTFVPGGGIGLKDTVDVQSLYHESCANGLAFLGNAKCTEAGTGWTQEGSSLNLSVIGTGNSLTGGGDEAHCWRNLTLTGDGYLTMQREGQWSIAFSGDTKDFAGTLHIKRDQPLYLGDFFGIGNGNLSFAKGRIIIEPLFSSENTHNVYFSNNQGAREIGDLLTVGDYASKVKYIDKNNATVRVGLLNSDSTFAGSILREGSAVPNFVKEGTGTWTLDGVVDMHGTFTVQKGTTKFNSNVECNVSVGANGTLGGNGTIRGAVSATSGAKLLFSATEALTFTGTADLTNFSLDTTGLDAAKVYTVAKGTTSLPTLTQPQINDGWNVYAFNGNVVLDKTLIIAADTTLTGYSVPSVIQEAAAWYDPSDTSTLEKDANDKVVGIKNKILDANLDLVVRDDESKVGATVVDNAFNNTKSLCFNNSAGYHSVGAFPSSLPPSGPRTLFAVVHGSSVGFIGVSRYSWDEEGRGILKADNGWGKGYQIAHWKFSEQNQQWEWGSGTVGFEYNYDKPCVMFGRTQVGADGYDDGYNTITAGLLYSDNQTSGDTKPFYMPVSSAHPSLKVYYATFEHPAQNFDTNGYQGEALIFTKALNDTQMAQVNEYLRAKWLDTNKPSELPKIGTIEANARVDLGGVIREFANISGSGSFVNGTVVLNGTLEVTVDAQGNVAPSFKKLVLGPSAKLVVTVDGSATLPVCAKTSAVSNMKPLIGDCEGEFATVDIVSDNKRIGVAYGQGGVYIYNKAGVSLFIY